MRAHAPRQPASGPLLGLVKIGRLLDGGWWSIVKNPVSYQREGMETTPAENTMRYIYSSLHHIRGLTPSSPATDEEIFADSAGSVRAVLTSDPTRLCDGLDTASALIATVFTGLFGENEPGTIDERLARRVQLLREERAKKFEAGVFLFFEAKGETAPITPHTQNDCGTFVLALDGLPKRDIRDRHEPQARRMLAAMGLGFTDVAGFEKVADAIVFFETDGKPIYGFNIEGGRADLLVSRRPSAGDLAATRQLASRILTDTSLDRVVRLLNESLEPSQAELRRFLSSWMALEVFVNTNFGAYQTRFWEGLSVGVSQPIRERYLKRIHDVMGDKYTPLDKFVVISSELDPSGADGDIETFRRGKRLRDDFSHGEAIVENALPVAEVQALVRKLLRLHLERTN